MSEAGQWRRCSACKRAIAFGAAYQVCSVSTCNRERTGLAFCSVECWEVHLPSANHREAWAVERRAPASAAAAGASGRASAAAAGADAARATAAREATASGRRVLVRGAGPPPAPEAPQEVLIVASRLKDYIRAKAGFNTSDGVLEPLSDIVRRVCDEAIRSASRDGRKTVLERDVPKS